MDPQFPDFPRGEFEARYARARNLMDNHRIDALLITERLNYQYFSGHRSEQNAVDKIRSYMFILPRDDDPVLITMPFEVAQVEQTTYIRDIRTTGALTGHPEFVAGILERMNLGRARIGAELGREQYLGISYESLREIMSRLSGADFIDASALLLQLRVRKSPLELDYMRRAGEISARAQRDTFGSIHSGMTENEVAHRLRRCLVDYGAERFSLLCVVSGPTPSTGIVLLPTDRILGAGETVGFDVGVSYRGYWSDVARTASIGQPTTELEEFYSWMMELRHACEQRLRPGESPAEVIETCDAILNARGLSTMGVGRIGHGVGIETTEYPSLAAFEDLRFAKGMVFACNPNFANHLGFINAEDNWAIGDDEPELLSAPVAEDRIPVVAC